MILPEETIMHLHDSQQYIDMVIEVVKGLQYTAVSNLAWLLFVELRTLVIASYRNLDQSDSVIGLSRQRVVLSKLPKECW
jgi:hypothetical protein